MLQQVEPITVHIEAGRLNAALKAVKPAISKALTRSYLCGVYMHYVDGAIRFVATDGQRLSIQYVKTDDDLRALPGVILPPTFVAAVIKATNKGSRRHLDCPIVIRPGNVTAHPYNEAAIDCEPIDGTFPDYQRVMPRDEKPKCGIYTFERSELLNAVRAVTDFREAVQPGNSAILLKFAGDQLTISTTINDGKPKTWKENGASVTLTLAEPAAVPCEVCFDGRYLVDALKTFDERYHVAFHFHDMGEPNVFQADTYGKWIIMPRRLIRRPETRA